MGFAITTIVVDSTILSSMEHALMNVKPDKKAQIFISVLFAKCRGVGLALLICFLEFWSGVIVFALFFLNVLSALW